MDMKDYSWHFGVAPALGSRGPTALRVLHTDFKNYLSNLQTSEFSTDCSYFHAALSLANNGKSIFTLKIDKDKFSLTEIESGKSICLEKFSTPSCTSSALMAVLDMFKNIEPNNQDSYNSLIEAIKSAI